MLQKRVVITGMSINTPIGDTLDEFINNMMDGKSAVTKWDTLDTSKIYAKVGGDLGNYDVVAKIKSYKGRIPEATYDRLIKLGSKSPLSIGISLLIAVEAFLDSGYIGSLEDGNNVATIIAGHNLNQKYTFENHDEFNEEPEFIDGLFALNGLDTHHVGSVTDVLQLHGPAYTVGAACASGNVALRCAVDEIQSHDVKVAAVVGPILDFSPLDLQGMCILGAITYKSFNEEPQRASRPYDTQREGFVPSHGAACLIVEDLEHALARGAKIYAEILGVESSSDGCHLPQPSQIGQSRLMKRLLKNANVKPEEVDYINVHATSTPLGDLTELRSIKDVFGDHCKTLKINAPKSILGHTCWSAATVETVAAILQMNRNELHPSINIDNLDPEVDVDVCRGERKKHNIDIFLKNSFGFGGLNSISLIKKYKG
ncbi:beta-ketoacyl-[acyl-carrier-protein] synthase family protein [Aurantibacillus circumpalustris]|uniref:beta-ketoacyl-[acyl-carrier-protein] synthase family protein n=1 Tax=Aurantibacillus circumpalustris TaxID=3036359 RepID=UPI00295B200B|nr:beta-ketoacyl-[acyl-carrier-protein] synthase family protein [Aurantibacillus circumpalustris]